MNIERKIEHETILGQYRNGGGINLMRNLVPAGHQIGQANPIFREISPEEADAWRTKFGGKK